LLDIIARNPDAFVFYAAGEGALGVGHDRVPAQAAVRGMSRAYLDAHLVIANAVPSLADMAVVKD
jgi:hypothetical protein